MSVMSAEEQTSGNLRSVPCDAEHYSLALTLLLLSHQCCWCLHGIAMLKPKVLHKYVNVSGIVLMHGSSLSPMQPPVQRFDALRRTIADDLRSDGIHARQLPLEVHQFLCWPYEHEVVTGGQTRHSVLFVVKQILRAESKLKSPSS